MRPLAECHGAMATAIMLSICVAYPIAAIQKYRCALPFACVAVPVVETAKVRVLKPYEDRLPQQVQHRGF